MPSASDSCSVSTGYLRCRSRKGGAIFSGLGVTLSTEWQREQLSDDTGVIKQDYLSEFYDQFVLSEEKACHIYFETEIVPLLSVEFEGDFTINIGTEDAYIQVSYRDHLLTFDRSKAGYPIKAAEDEASVRQCRLVYDKIKVSLVVDVSTIELLINNEYVFSNTMYPKADNGKIEVHSEKFKV